MKALQVFFMLLPFTVLAQADSSYGHSRFQQFLMKPGRLVQITSDTIGILGSVEAGSVTALDLQTGEKKRAICFNPGSLFSSTVFTVTNTQLDIDELDPLIRILDTVNRILFSKKAPKDLEFRYVSSGLTEIVASTRINKPKRWDIVIYRRFIHFEGIVPGTFVSIREADIEPLLQLLIRYKAALGTDLLQDI
jgi:hypothetical protein